MIRMDSPRGDFELLPFARLPPLSLLGFVRHGQSKFSKNGLSRVPLVSHNPIPGL